MQTADEKGLNKLVIDQVQKLEGVERTETRNRGGVKQAGWEKSTTSHRRWSELFACARMPIRIGEVGVAKPAATLLAIATGGSIARLVPSRDALAQALAVFPSPSLICAPLPGIASAMPARAHLHSGLLLLAITAESRPGHSLQPGSRDGPLAGFAHSECLPVDPSQGLLDRS